MNKRKVIIESTDALKDWLTSTEGIFILLSGGYERTFRDKLMYQIQVKLNKGIVVSERTLRKKRPDILIIEDIDQWEEKNTVVEIKINSFNQVKEITGKTLAEIKEEIKSKNKILTKNVNCRLVNDFNRWASRENHKPIYFIYLIVDVKNIEKSFENFFNYRSKRTERPFNYQDLDNYLVGICTEYKEAKIELFHRKKYSKKISNPFAIALDLYLNVFEMTNRAK